MIEGQERNILVDDFLAKLRRYKGAKIPNNVSRNENLNRIALSLKRSGLIDEIPLEVMKNALNIYLDNVSHGISRGRGCTAVLAACILVASRSSPSPVTLRYVSRALKIDPSRIWRTESLVVKNTNGKNMAVRPIDFIERYAESLNVDDDVRDEAIALTNKIASQVSLMRKSPSTIAISALYLASILKDRKLVQRYVTKKTGITEVTLIRTYKEIYSYLTGNQAT